MKYNLNFFLIVIVIIFFFHSRLTENDAAALWRIIAKNKILDRRFAHLKIFEIEQFLLEMTFVQFSIDLCPNTPGGRALPTIQDFVVDPRQIADSAAETVQGVDLPH